MTAVAPDETQLRSLLEDSPCGDRTARRLYPNAGYGSLLFAKVKHNAVGKWRRTIQSLAIMLWSLGKSRQVRWPS